MFIMKIGRLFIKVGETLMSITPKRLRPMNIVYARELLDDNSVMGEAVKINKLLVRCNNKSIVIDMDRALPSNRMRAVKATKLAIERFITKNADATVDDLRNVILVKHRENPSAGRLYKEMILDKTLQGGQIIVDKKATLSSK